MLLHGMLRVDSRSQCPRQIRMTRDERLFLLHLAWENMTMRTMSLRDMLCIARGDCGRRVVKMFVPVLEERRRRIACCSELETETLLWFLECGDDFHFIDSLSLFSLMYHNPVSFSLFFVFVSFVYFAGRKHRTKLRFDSHARADRNGIEQFFHIRVVERDAAPRPIF